MKKEVKKSKAIDGKELIIAMDELEKEKGIKKDVLIESIETALITAYKRNYDSNSDNVKVIMDKETGETHLYIEKDVVENVEDEKLQISLEDAHKVSKKLEIGDKALKTLDVLLHKLQNKLLFRKLEKYLEKYYLMNLVRKREK